MARARSAQTTTIASAAVSAGNALRQVLMVTGFTDGGRSSAVAS
jgi:uncharacterized Rossmann fold enzyme